MFTSPMKAARETRGALGLQSLVSLLLTLEARFYVVTALSNWGALIHELHTVLSEGEGRGHPSLADSYVVNLNHTYAARIRIREFMRIREEKALLRRFQAGSEDRELLTTSQCSSWEPYKKEQGKTGWCPPVLANASLNCAETAHCTHLRLARVRFSPLVARDESALSDP